MPQTNLTPIIVVTLYRRYYEFVDSIENINRLKKEFKVPPIIIVIWAVPEEDKFGLMEKLLTQGKIHYVLERKISEYDGWNKPTTLAELLNFEVAINFIKGKFVGYYIILEGADILVNNGIYYWIDNEIRYWAAILFFWNNNLTIEDAWHSNFFVIKDLNYWPKYEEKYAHDTLETMWGKRLRDEKLTDFLHSHNSRHQRFTEIHSSTKDSIYPVDRGSGVFSFRNGAFTRTLSGYIKYYYNRVKGWLK